MKNISLKRDDSGDIFLNIKSCKEKKYASINLNSLTKKLAPIAGCALIGWAEENLEEIKVNNKK